MAKGRNHVIVFDVNSARLQLVHSHIQAIRIILITSIVPLTGEFFIKPTSHVEVDV